MRQRTVALCMIIVALASCKRKSALTPDSNYCRYSIADHNSGLPFYIDSLAEKKLYLRQTTITPIHHPDRDALSGDFRMDYMDSSWYLVLHRDSSFSFGEQTGKWSMPDSTYLSFINDTFKCEPRQLNGIYSVNTGYKGFELTLYHQVRFMRKDGYEEKVDSSYKTEYRFSLR